MRTIQCIILPVSSIVTLLSCTELHSTLKGNANESNTPILAISDNRVQSRVIDFDFTPTKIINPPPPPPAIPTSIIKIVKEQGITHATVIVEVYVNEQGVPTSAKAIEGPELFHQITVDYIMTWRFSPKFINGVIQPNYRNYYKITAPYKFRQ